MGSELDVLCAGLPGIEDVKKTLEDLLLLAEYLNKVILSSSGYLTESNVRGETSGGQ